MTINLTIPLWLPALYLIIGAVAWLPLEYKAHRSIHRPPPFWSGLWKGIKRRPITPIIAIVAWPLAMWESFR